MMVYPEEPSIWTIPHIPALYDDDGDYGGKKLNFCPHHRQPETRGREPIQRIGMIFMNEWSGAKFQWFALRAYYRTSLGGLRTCLMKKEMQETERSRWVMIDQVEMLRFRSPSIFSHIPSAQKKHRQSPSRYIFHFHFALYSLSLFYKTASDENIQKEWFNINKWFFECGVHGMDEIYCSW